nr:tetratricopeptide repeat protein [Saprospiraceae bacterium]
MRLLLTGLCFLLIALSVQGQSAQLANQYFSNKEYDKAASMYEALLNQNDRSTHYFDRLMDCYIHLDQLDLAESAIRDRMKKYARETHLHLTLGKIYEERGEMNKAEREFQQALKNLPADRGSVIRQAVHFTNMGNFEMALKTYEKGIDLLDDETIFAYNLADLYRRTGNREKMVYFYLINLRESPNRLNNLQTIFQRFFSEEDYEELEAQLYGKIQEHPDMESFPELLAWLFINREDFSSALQQYRALDRRLNENGERVFRLGQTAENEGDLNTAIAAYNYITENKGIDSPYYISSKQNALNAMRKRIHQNPNATRELLVELEKEYLSFLDEFGRNTRTAPLISELGRFYALHLNEIDKAISVLDELLKMPGLNKYIAAQAKLDLGDYYLIKGERWEATLLYSQVDKDFPEEILGEDARFRNARLSYFMGDFTWAQSQFDILKAATTRLIANDAIDLSVFITEHIGLDTTAQPLERFANAELLIFQNRHAEAFEILDNLLKEYPEHTLESYVFYTKGQAYREFEEFEKAHKYYEKVVKKHPDGIRADHALYRLGVMWEEELGDPQKASEYYEVIFLDYPDSRFSANARDRYRSIRDNTLP